MYGLAKPKVRANYSSLAIFVLGDGHTGCGANIHQSDESSTILPELNQQSLSIYDHCKGAGFVEIIRCLEKDEYGAL